MGGLVFSRRHVYISVPFPAVADGTGPRRFCRQGMNHHAYRETTMNSSHNKRELGSEFEELALAFLLNLGYRLVQRNFHFGNVGEIDLVMQDGDVYVFVEVKGRRSHTFGLPEEAITRAKRKTLNKVARGFFHVNRRVVPTGRFDVVAVDFVTGRNGKPEIRHYPDAF